MQYIGELTITRRSEPGYLQVLRLGVGRYRGGQRQGVEILLPAGPVADEHFALDVHGHGANLLCLAGSTLTVDGRSITERDRWTALQDRATFQLADFTLQWMLTSHGQRAVDIVIGRVGEAYLEYLRALHTAVVDVLADRRRRALEPLPRPKVVALIHELSLRETLAPPHTVVYEAARIWLRDVLLDIATGAGTPGGAGRITHELIEAAQRTEPWWNQLTTGLLDVRIGALREGGLHWVDRICTGGTLDDTALRALAQTHFVETVCAQVFDFGPLTRFLNLPDLEEIMVVSPSAIYIARAGRTVLTGRSFLSERDCLTVLERIVHTGGRRLDFSSPMVDVRLTDGSRVNAVIDPAAVNGPHITIRRFPGRPLNLGDFVDYATLTSTSAEFLIACMRAGLSILVAGGTGSGKTTLLAALASAGGAADRIVTVEDTAELRIQAPHVLTLQARTANSEGQGAVTIRDLVKNALRMRPDRIVVGEVRGGEALDMVQAMATGHSGMATIHADSSEEAVARVEALSSGQGLDAALVRFQFARAVHIIVQLTRRSDGRRLVQEIVEVADFDAQTEQVLLEPVFRRRHAYAPLRYTGRIPNFVGRLQRSGFDPSTGLSWK